MQCKFAGLGENVRRPIPNSINCISVKVKLKIIVYVCSDSLVKIYVVWKFGKANRFQLL